MIDLDAATVEERDGVPAPKGHRSEIVRYREARGRLTSPPPRDDVPALPQRCRARLTRRF